MSSLKVVGPERTAVLLARLLLLVVGSLPLGCGLRQPIVSTEPASPLPATRDVLRLLEDHYLEVVDPSHV
jgi:hypothetical protein